MASSHEETVCVEDGERESLESVDSLKEKTAVTAIGKVKTFAGLKVKEVIFLTISALSVIVAIGLTIERLVKLEKDTPDYTFAIILFINIGFCLFYAVHGVLREREFELYAYFVGILVLLCYISVDLIVNKKRTALKWARFGVMLLLGPGNIYYWIKVARGFGFIAFRTIGASKDLHRMYRNAGMFSCLLKFDFQLAVSLAVFVITNVRELELHDKVTVGVSIPLQLAWSILGWFAMRREMMILVKIFIPLSIVEPAYLIYRIIKLATNWDEDTKDGKNVLVYSFLGAASLAFFVRVLVLVTLKFVVNNFGKGLKETAFDLSVTGDQPQERGTELIAVE